MKKFFNIVLNNLKILLAIFISMFIVHLPIVAISTFGLANINWSDSLSLFLLTISLILAFPTYKFLFSKTKEIK